MREIKFRAWDIQDNKMIYNIQDASEIRMNYDFVLGTNPFYFFLKHGDFEVMQYTGLKDKNDKEIYEGDVLCHWSNLHTHRGAGWVVYDGAGFYLDQSKGKKNTALKLLGSAYVPLKESIVIGNIHENPELLEI